MESNVNSYKLEQSGKNYIFIISIEDNELKLSCKNESQPTVIFSRSFTVEGLQKLDEIFNIIKTPLDAIKWIDEALKVQKVSVFQKDSSFKIIFAITTKGITHQIDIPLNQEGELPTTIKEETPVNLVEESKEINQTNVIGDSEFNREIGLDPSKILRQTLNENNTSQEILSSLDAQQKNYLAQINYTTNNTYDSYTPLNVENTNVNIETNYESSNYESYPVQDQGYQNIDDNTNFISTVTNNETNYQYGETNYDLGQYSTTNAQEDTSNYISSTPEIISGSTEQYTNIENTNYTFPETSTQYNAEEYNVANIPETNQQYTEYEESSNQYVNNYDYSNQVSLPVETGDIQTMSTFDSKPYIAPADEVYEQTNQFTTTTNYENYDQGTTTDVNYNQYFSNATENITEYNTQNLVNTEYNTVETGNEENYGIETTGNLEGFGVNIAETNIITDNQTNDIETLKTNVDELMGFKDQIGQIDLVKTQAEEIKKLKLKIAELENSKKTENKNTEEDSLKQKIKELEDTKLQQEQEIKDLKRQSAKKPSLEEEKEEKEEIKEEVKQEIKEEKKEEAKQEIKEEVKKEVKQEIKQEVKEIKKEAPKIERRHVFGERTQKYKVKGDIIHTKEEIELITRKINKVNKKITLNLIYKATVDSDKAEAFHEKCDNAKSSIVLVETDKGKRFGGFTTSSWSGDCVDKKDEDAFVFSLDKMKVYSNIPDEDAIGCYPKYGPIFLGCQIRIYDRAFSKGGTTYEKGLNYNTEEDFELTDGDREFKVKEIEVYEVVAE